MKKYRKVLSMACALALLLGATACAASDGGETAKEEDSTVVNETNSAAADETEGAAGSNVLVAYFSATGTTKPLAEYAAESLGADLYEIVPEQPYTSEDLNYNDDNSRTSIEQNDTSVRPEISGEVEDMEQYGIVFLAYPIWWGQAPRIISTFLESYDFSGKTIVPFCTSGSSSIGSSAENLHDLCAEDVTWLDGERLSGSTSREEMAEWINNLGLELTAE